ncbi:hypothetical protein PVAG01_03418 [Phlyctema vagabunda]|uniref:Centromere protein X n=1 Tax=Phlyctema vagabunda TaxID=108571 RepID=A0ABR4PLC2_9HELO
MPPKAFKPPQQNAAAAKKAASKAAPRTKSTGVTKRKTAAKSKVPAKAASPAESDGDQEEEPEELDDPFASPKEAIEIDSDASQEQAGEEEEEEEEEEEAHRASIPPELLTRLLHEFFQKDGTRVQQSANAAIGKYIDVFARESLARCVWLKADKAQSEGMLDNGFCEVEDLEKLAPQLLLDF